MGYRLRIIDTLMNDPIVLANIITTDVNAQAYPSVQSTLLPVATIADVEATSENAVTTANRGSDENVL